MIVGGSKCALAGKDCAGRLEWRHALSQSRLKREFKYGAYYSPLYGWTPAHRHAPVSESGPWQGGGKQRTLDDIIADPRNRMWLCSEGAHEPVTNARVHLAIPDSVWAFCADFGLTGALENDLARRVA